VGSGEEKPPNIILAASWLRWDTDSAGDGFQPPFAHDASVYHIRDKTCTLKKQVFIPDVALLAACWSHQKYL